MTDQPSRGRPTIQQQLSVRSAILIGSSILVAYFIIQSVLFRDVEEDFTWLDQWDASTASNEDPEFRLEDLRNTLGRDPDPAEVPPPLSELLDRLTRGVNTGDAKVLSEAIDWDAYVTLTSECRYWKSGRSDSHFRSWAKDGINYPWKWSRYRVLDWRMEDGQPSMATVLLDDGDGRFHELRLWLTAAPKKGVSKGQRAANERWSLADWEVVDFGIRETAEAALMWTLRDDPSAERYDRLIAMPRTDPSVFDPPVDLPSVLHDVLMVQLAYDYLELENWGAALAMASRVRYPKVAVGAMIAEARAHVFLEDIESAEAATDRLEKHIGRSLHVLQLREAIEIIREPAQPREPPDSTG